MREKSYRRKHNVQHDQPLVDFQIGDYVLVAIPTKHKHKLRAIWRGPFEVIQELEPYVYQVRHLVTNVLRETHISRVKYYADAEVDMDIPEVLNQIINEEIDGYKIEAILAHRMNRTEHEVYIKWLGIDALENTWEPLRDIYDNHKKCLKEYIKSLPNSPQNNIIKDIVETWNELRAG
jgi:hypothetical protein